MALVGLTDKADVRVTKLSGGQQRRLDVGVGLAGDPDLLFLDEPTTGFDPGARRSAWEMIKGLAGMGKTIFLTTHFMDEAQYLADRVAIISAGRIIAQGPPETLAGRDTGDTVIRFRLAGTEMLPGPVRDDRPGGRGVLGVHDRQPGSLPQRVDHLGPGARGGAGRPGGR